MGGEESFIWADADGCYGRGEGARCRNCDVSLWANFETRKKTMQLNEEVLTCHRADYLEPDALCFLTPLKGPVHIVWTER